MGRLLYGKRKNAVHRTSDARPTLAAMLAQTTTESLPAAVKQAVQMKQVSREQIAAILKQHRTMRRLDRSDVLLQTLREAEQPLTAQHYCIAMAHANDERKTVKALQWWKEAVKEGKANEQLHGVLLSTYRNAGRWSDALLHCDAMWEDKMAVDAHALHAAMNACRLHGPWEAGLAVFAKAVSAGTTPNGVVYLELLRLIARGRLRSRWSYSLAILDALEPRTELTAGHYNAVIETMGGLQWERGMEVFQRMQRQNVQPSAHTIEKLLLLHPHSVSHCIRCVAEAHVLGMPVTDTMYRAVLTGLFQRHLNEDAVQFLAREYSQDTTDTSNPSSNSLALSVALLDALLAHPKPHDALAIYETYEPRLGDVVGAATRYLGSPGHLSQRWLVQGRVAVVDHNVLLSTTFESLIHHYDSIFVPLAAVRLLARRARETGDSAQGRYMRATLRRVSALLKREEWSMIRVLPYAHQLLSHSYLAERSPASPAALLALRAAAEKTAPQLSYGEALLQRLGPVTTAAKEKGVEARGVRGSQGDEGQRSVVEGEGLIIRQEGYRDIAYAQRGAVEGRENDAKRGGDKVVEVQESVLRDKSRISSVERVIAVAAMLKSLNPDAEVHVLSSNRAQIAATLHWNDVRPSCPIVAVRYPDELAERAPPEDPTSILRQSR